MSRVPPTRLEPITSGDVDRVGEFLQASLNARVKRTEWAQALRVPWNVAAPNHGYMLMSEDVIVGAYLAFYSERTIGDTVQRFCNLGAWCVLPGFRFQALRLLQALLAQPGYHFTDLSPSGHTVDVNVRLRFEFLDTTTALIPSFPWPSPPRPDVGVICDRAAIERTLTGRDLDIYRDHARTSAAHHLVLRCGERFCYVMFRRDRRKGLPLFASILHVSDPDVFRTMVRRFARHLLIRHGIVATLAELRVVKHKPPHSFLVRGARPKMFRSPALRPDQIDYLYSELVCVAW